jgi:hypothetical protein
VLCTGWASPPPQTRTSPPSRRSHRRLHFRGRISHPSRGSWRRPPRHAPRHRHRGRFHQPPHLPQDPFPRCCYSRGSSLTSGQTETNEAMTLLHSVGDEAAGRGGVSRASFVAGALQGPAGAPRRIDSGELLVISCLCRHAC